MEFEPTSPQAWLQHEFSLRRKKNPRYSLRMFAQRLELPSGRISELLSGRRQFTVNLGKKIASRLGLDPDKREGLIELILRSRKESDSESAAKHSNQEYLQLTSDIFEAISDPNHFSILSLMETDDFQNDPRWIAHRLNLSTVETRAALTRLQRLGLVVEENGMLKPKETHLTTSHDIESAALRKSHRRTLEQAIETIDSVPIDLRDITSMTMAIDIKRLSQAKGKIKKLRRELSEYLESGSSKNEVYNLNIQLVPVSRIEKQEKKK